MHFSRLPFAIILACISISPILLTSCQNTYFDQQDASKMSVVLKDKSKAVETLLDLAEQGNAEAQLNLGLMYDKGDGVQQDPSKALKWFKKAANQGNASAQYIMGDLYQTGKIVDKNDFEAAKWFEKAANQGMAEAQREIGIIYYNGVGVSENNAVAKEWFKKSCENGFKLGCEDYDYLNSSSLD